MQCRECAFHTKKNEHVERKKYRYRVPADYLRVEYTVAIKISGMNGGS